MEIRETDSAFSDPPSSCSAGPIGDDLVRISHHSECCHEAAPKERDTNSGSIFQFHWQATIMGPVRLAFLLILVRLCFGSSTDHFTGG